MGIEYLVRGEREDSIKGKTEIDFLRDAINEFREVFNLDNKNITGNLVVKREDFSVGIYPKNEKDNIEIHKRIGISNPIKIEGEFGYNSGIICIKLKDVKYKIHSKPEY